MNPLIKRGWLSRRPRELQDALLRRGRAAQYAARDFVYHLSDEPAGIYGILSGSFGLLAATERTEPRLGHVLHPGDWFGEGPILTGRRRTLSVQALTAAEVVYVPLNDLCTLCATTPEWHREFAVLAAENASLAASVAASLLLRGSEARLAAALLRVAGRTVLSPTGPLFPVRLNQKELGEVANVSRQVVNATLRRWQQRGWIVVGYGEVVVADVESLLARTAATDS